MNLLFKRIRKIADAVLPNTCNTRSQPQKQWCRIDHIQQHIAVSPPDDFNQRACRAKVFHQQQKQDGKGGKAQSECRPVKRIFIRLAPIFHTPSKFAPDYSFINFPDFNQIQEQTILIYCS